MGALQGGRCFLSSSDALDAYYMGAPIQMVSGASSYATTFEKVGNVWKANGYSVDASGTWVLRYSTIAPMPAFPYCDQFEGLRDGIAVGWMVATCFVIAASFIAMKRAAR